MKNLLFLAPLALLACTKETQFSGTINSATSVTYDEATLSVTYEVPKNTYNTSAGLYYGLNPNPDGTNTNVPYQILGPADVETTFQLSDLIAEETYYARAWITTEDGNINISDNYTFTTSSLPSLPCSLPAQTLKVDGTDYTTDPLSPLQTNDNFILSSQTSLGGITFYFWQDPTSGIYKTRDSESFVGEGEIVMKFWLSNAPICEYRADEWKDIQVINNNGNYTVEFCDLDVTKINLGSCAGTKVVSGRFSM